MVILVYSVKGMFLFVCIYNLIVYSPDYKTDWIPKTKGKVTIKSKLHVEKRKKKKKKKKIEKFINKVIKGF
jgi:hypothetical protein